MTDPVFRVELCDGPYDGHVAYYDNTPPKVLEFAQMDEARDEKDRPMPGCMVRRVSRYVRVDASVMRYWPEEGPMPGTERE